MSFTAAIVREKAILVNDVLKTVPEILDSSSQKSSLSLLMLQGISSLQSCPSEHPS